MFQPNQWRWPVFRARFRNANRIGGPGVQALYGTPRASRAPNGRARTRVTVNAARRATGRAGLSY